MAREAGLEPGTENSRHGPRLDTSRDPARLRRSGGRAVGQGARHGDRAGHAVSSRGGSVGLLDQGQGRAHCLYVVLAGVDVVVADPGDDPVQHQIR